MLLQLELLESRLVCSIFGAPNVLPTGREVRGVVQGDLNGDGRADLVVANRLSNRVTVLVSLTSPTNTTPTYGGQQDYRSGRDPTFVNLADMNADGRLDMVVSNGGSNNLALYLNATSPGEFIPQFLPRQDVDLDHNATALVDLNGDQVPDVAAVNRENGVLSVWTNQTPALGTKVVLNYRDNHSVGFGCRFIVGGDLDNDGDNDLVVSSQDRGEVSVLWNTTPIGKRHIEFNPDPVQFIGGQPRDLALGDLNGDGLLDIAVARQGVDDLMILYGDREQGAYRLREHQVSVGAGQRGIVAGDLDGDGKAEVVVTLRDRDLAVVVSDEAPVEFFMTGRFPLFAHLADVNADGRPDLAIGCRDDGTAEVRLNTL